MDVNDFEMLLIDVTFYRCHVQKLVFDVVIQKRIYPGPAVKGLNDCSCHFIM